MSLTTLLAIWGALLSTALGGFEIYKFIYRARLHVEVGTGFITITPGIGIDHTELMTFHVSNIGSQPTTLRNIVFRAYRERRGWRRWIKPTKQGIITVSKIPARIEPGDIWSKAVPQGDFQNYCAELDECLICVYHSMSHRPVISAVSFPKDAS